MSVTWESNERRKAARNSLRKEHGKQDHGATVVGTYAWSLPSSSRTFLVRCYPSSRPVAKQHGSRSSSARCLLPNAPPTIWAQTSPHQAGVMERSTTFTSVSICLVFPNKRRLLSTHRWITRPRKRALPRVKSLESKGKTDDADTAHLRPSRGRENDCEDVAVSPDLPRAFTDQVHRPPHKINRADQRARCSPASAPSPSSPRNLGRNALHGERAVGWARAPCRGMLFLVQRRLG